jgi:hypothetical protein
MQRVWKFHLTVRITVPDDVASKSAKANGRQYVSSVRQSRVVHWPPIDVVSTEKTVYNLMTYVYQCRRRYSGAEETDD